MNAIGPIPVTPVGKPGRAWLELRGSILIYRRESWVTSASLFIPVEWVRVHQKYKRDMRRLWHGLLGLMAAALFALPLVLLVFYMAPHEPGDLWIGLALTALLITALASGVWALARFFVIEPVTELRIANNAYPFSVAFWRRPGNTPTLDDLVAYLSGQIGAVETHLPYPVRMSHLWRRPRPYRIALVKGLAVSFVLYVVLLLFESLRLAGVGPSFPRWIYLLLAAPPLLHLLEPLVRRGPLIREPTPFRRALRAYHRGDLEKAQAHLDALLETHPDHHMGRLLMVHVCAEACAFDRAMAHCNHLTDEDPILATHLQANIWGLKRLHDRMR